jgi:hypothetical protein
MVERVDDISSSATATAARRLRRWRPGLGVTGGLLVWIGASLFGDTPDTRDTTAEIAAYFVAHRTSVMVGAVVLGVGLLCLLATVTRATTRVAAAGQADISHFAQSAATVGLGVLFGTVVLINATLAYVVGAEAPAIAKGLFELTLVATPVASLAFAVSLGAVAVGLARSDTASRRSLIVTSLASVVLAVSAASYAASGPFSPDVQQPVMLLALVMWMILSGFGRRVGFRPVDRPGRREPDDVNPTSC